MKVEIKRVESLKELKAFVRFPYSIYKGDPYWVPPLDMDDLTTLQEGQEPRLRILRGRILDGLRGRQGGRPHRRHHQQPRHREVGQEVRPLRLDRLRRGFRSGLGSGKDRRGLGQVQGAEGFRARWALPTSTGKGCSSRASTSSAPTPPDYNKPYYPPYLGAARLHEGHRLDRVPRKDPGRDPREGPARGGAHLQAHGRAIYEWKNKKELVKGTAASSSSSSTRPTRRSTAPAP